MGAERLMWIDLEQRLFTDDGQGNGWFRLDRSTLLPLVSMLESTSGGMPGSGPGGSMAFTDILPVISSPAAALMSADRRETHDRFEESAKRFEEASALPMRERARIDAMPTFDVVNRVRALKPGASVIASVRASKGVPNIV